MVKLENKKDNMENSNEGILEITTTVYEKPYKREK